MDMLNHSKLIYAIILINKYTWIKKFFTKKPQVFRPGNLTNLRHEVSNLLFSVYANLIEFDYNLDERGYIIFNSFSSEVRFIIVEK